jgi:hypothetical protein
LSISFSEAVATLLKGGNLTWPKFEDQKGGTIIADTPGKRRLFKFLLAQNSANLKAPTEVVFKGLIEVWEMTSDPGSESEDSGQSDNTDSWRLVKIEASNFSGLTTLGGMSFELVIGGEN